MLDVNGDNIFGCCKQLLEKIEKKLFLYKTDGLIFTPIKNGVGADKPGKSSKLRKTVWDYSFKWKPPEFNTIDFLVTTKKSENGEDFIGNLFVENIEKRQNYQIGCLEEIALNKKWISKVNINKRIKEFKNSSYSNYLKNLI